jgi:hypothetical protein
MIFALKELYHTLSAAWKAADLHRRLEAWRYVVTHRKAARLADTAPTVDRRR